MPPTGKNPPLPRKRRSLIAPGFPRGKGGHPEGNPQYDAQIAEKGVPMTKFVPMIHPVRPFFSAHESHWGRNGGAVVHEDSGIIQHGLKKVAPVSPVQAHGGTSAAMLLSGWPRARDPFPGDRREAGSRTGTTMARKPHFAAWEIFSGSRPTKPMAPSF